MTKQDSKSLIADLFRSMVAQRYFEQLDDYEKTKGKFFCMELRAYGETGEIVWVSTISKDKEAFEKFWETTKGKMITVDLQTIIDKAEKYHSEAHDEN